MRLVLALGGNALVRRGQRAEADLQRRNVVAAARALAPLAGEHELVITHGNGPQVGLLALEADAYKAVRPYPLDLLGAESQGMIGSLLVTALRNALLGREVVALLTHVVVDPADPAFAAPTKPIGPVYTEIEARALAKAHAWTIAPDGDAYRRVVASPEPWEIVEIESVARLLAGGAVVVCAGGGGIPVTRDGDRLRPVEAVIDKDLTAALLAAALGADRLLMLTDVPAVESGWGTPAAAPIAAATPAQLRRLRFAPGSIAPKVEAACRFVERTGGEASIGALGDLRAVAAGRAGTRVAQPRRRQATRPAARGQRPART